MDRFSSGWERTIPSGQLSKARQGPILLGGRMSNPSFWWWTRGGSPMPQNRSEFPRMTGRSTPQPSDLSGVAGPTPASQSEEGAAHPSMLLVGNLDGQPKPEFEEDRNGLLDLNPGD